MIDDEIIGCVIKMTREKMKLSQEVVSGFADIGRAHLSAIERGTRRPTLYTFCKIADALQIAPSELLRKIEILSGETSHENN